MPGPRAIGAHFVEGRCEEGPGRGEEGSGRGLEGPGQHQPQTRRHGTCFQHIHVQGGVRKAYFPYFHLMFDGSTGNNGWCPVTLTDFKKRPRELVVLSVQVISRFMIEESPDPQEFKTTFGFLNGPDFKAATDMSYDDEINAYLNSGFKFLARGRCMSNNRKTRGG